MFNLEENFTDIIDVLRIEHAVSFPLLREPDRKQLLREARVLEYKSGPEYVGTHKVHQQMESSEIEVGSPNGLALFSGSFSKKIKFLSKKYKLDLFNPEFGFNEFIVNKYKQGSVGITPHRDNAYFKNLIALVVLSGSGEFYTCDDRDRKNSRLKKTIPGNCILMVAPGFMNKNIQPMHYVTNITEDRYILCLRQKIEK